MAPAWRAAPLPKAHCAAAAAIEATATEPWTEAQLLQELDAPAGRLFGLYAGETLCGAALPNGSQPMSASEMPMQTSSITLHRASTRYILLRVSSGCFFFDLVFPAM